LERNLQLYVVYCGTRNLIFWLPIFFLYFSSILSVSEVLLLEAIYYAAVVLLEVPSGYLSDRIGRRITLMTAMAAWSSACFVFAFTGGFWSFATAQILLAAGMAFHSGTDSSMLFDSLKALDRTDEYAEREARAQAVTFSSMAIAALVGGCLAGFDLRIAYLLSGIGGVLAVGVAASFAEPIGGSGVGFLAQLKAVRAHGAHPVLRWIFAYAVGMTVINHVPYELFQPWIALFLGGPESGYSPTPVATGVLMAVTLGVSAIASSQAIYLRDRFGVASVLLATILLQAVIIASLAGPIHVGVLGLLALRAIPAGLAGPVANAAIHPHLESSVRATWLSIQSLVGRLAFSGTLVAASAWTAGAPMTHRLIADLASVTALAAVLLAVILLFTRPTVLRQRGV